MRLAEGEANWVEVYVAGHDAAARTRCHEALAHEQRRAERLPMKAVVARDCSLEPLPSLIAASGEATTLVAEEDPSSALSLERVLRTAEAEPDSAPKTTVVRLTRFDTAAACAAALRKLKAAQERSTREAQEDARAWLNQQRTDLEARRARACAEAEAGRTECQRIREPMERGLCEVGARRLEGDCTGHARLVASLERRMQEPAPPAEPFLDRCLPWHGP